MTYRNPDLLRLARLAPRCMSCDCTNDGTVVAAHANHIMKGLGIKAPDWAWAALCWKCHAFLDQGMALTREDRREMWLQAFYKTQDWLWASGFLQVAASAVEPPHARAGTATRPIKKKVAKSRPMQGGGFQKGPKRPIPSRPLRP